VVEKGRIDLGLESRATIDIAVEEFSGFERSMEMKLNN
jgi:hypothetical protein